MTYNKKTTIGIIGGCGSYAAIDIQNKLLKVTKELCHAKIDQDYFNTVIYQYTQFPDRNDAICLSNTSLYDKYLECAKKLKSIGVDLLLIACNTAHVNIEKLRDDLGIPIVNMVQETARFTINNFSNIKKIGLLSTEAT